MIIILIMTVIIMIVMIVIIMIMTNFIRLSMSELKMLCFNSQMLLNNILTWMVSGGFFLDFELNLSSRKKGGE